MQYGKDSPVMATQEYTRLSNGFSKKVENLEAAVIHPVSRQWSGYWQRRPA
jgi:hypothetical protein